MGLQFLMLMTNYCLFTVEHPSAKRIYIRGVADITEPVDWYVKITQFYHGSKLKRGLPPNPYAKETEEFNLFNELISNIRKNWENFGDDLVFATDEQEFLDLNHKNYDFYTIDVEKVRI